jgi:thioredoxin-related protein
MRSWRSLALVAALLAPATELNAARELGSPRAGHRLEVLVLEVRNCDICSLVRTNVQPLYEQAAFARDVPMRYVDITRIDERRLGLRDSVRTVPTIVVIRDGEEVDRITGYMSPADTLRIIGQLIGEQD